MGNKRLLKEGASAHGPQPFFLRAVALLAVTLGTAGLSGCAASAPAGQPDLTPGGSVVFGRVVTVLMAPSSRTYEPKVRFFELMNRTTKERTRVAIDSNDKFFVLHLSAGDYELTRLQIHEGPFIAMADVSLAFRVGNETVSYLGTWRIGVDAPRNDRQVLVSAVQDHTERLAAIDRIRAQYPDLAEQSIVALLPEPASVQAPLFEVMPYPRVTPYYRRHW